MLLIVCIYNIQQSVLPFVPPYNSSARIPRKIPSSVINNACLLVRYVAMDVLLLLRANSGNVFTVPLHSNGHVLQNILIISSCSVFIIPNVLPSATFGKFTYFTSYLVHGQLTSAYVTTMMVTK
jgi:hypothetical protein